MKKARIRKENIWAVMFRQLGLLIILGIAFAFIVFANPKDIGLKYTTPTPTPKITLTPEQCKALQGKPMSIPAECQACFR